MVVLNMFLFGESIPNLTKQFFQMGGSTTNQLPSRQGIIDSKALCDHSQEGILIPIGSMGLVYLPTCTLKTQPFMDW